MKKKIKNERLIMKNKNDNKKIDTKLLNILQEILNMEDNSGCENT